MQNQVRYFTKNKKIHLIFKNQQLLEKSFFAKIRIINVLTENLFFPLDLNQEEKIQICLLLNKMKNIELFSILNIYKSKKKGLIFYDQFLDICLLAITELDALYLVPLIETNLTKCNFTQNIFHYEKNILRSLIKILDKKKKKDFWFIKIKLFCLWNSKTKVWLFKNLTASKKILNSLFLFKKIVSYKQSDPYFKDNFGGFSYKRIYKLLINYMLNDLVWLR